MENPLAYIFDAIDKSDFENKTKMKNKIVSCADDFFAYFRCVVNENIYYSKTSCDRLNAGLLKSLDEQRRSLHDRCVMDCASLNEICLSLNIDRLCDFDPEDRAKVAQFCGYIVSALYFGNIRNDYEVDEWMSSFPLVKED
jgi:hypothetical protein